MSIPKTPRGQWADINKRYFAGRLPTPRFTIVEAGGETPWIDTRDTWGSVHQDEEGGWHVQLKQILLEIPEQLYLTLGHEALHIDLGLKVEHNSAEWNAGYRRLLGAGFFRRIF